MTLIIGDATHLSNIAIQTGTPTDQDTLVYDSASGTWKHQIGVHSHATAVLGGSVSTY